MRTFRVLVASVITVGGMIVFAPAVAAGIASAADDALCSQLTIQQPDLSGLGTPSKFNKSEFKAAAKAFKSGAKGAPAKVKTAMLTMAAYFDKIGKARNANAALSSITPKDSDKFFKATAVFDKYFALNCA
jgi:hypothetical protein